MILQLFFRLLSNQVFQLHKKNFNLAEHMHFQQITILTDMKTQKCYL